jgi:iron(III)-enterobactin esterase
VNVDNIFQSACSRDIAKPLLNFLFTKIENIFLIYFWRLMNRPKSSLVKRQIKSLHSGLLQRTVTLDIYFPAATYDHKNISLLLINDGQDLSKMHFGKILGDLFIGNHITPLFCVGIGCGPDRRNEYGTANFLDYEGRGKKSLEYQLFIFEELIPFLRKEFDEPSFKDKSFCGFSMGGLSALDTVWNHPQEFRFVGVFSGSLWWRRVDQDDPLFNEDRDRIMHAEIRKGGYYPWLKFFFETGTLDETADRNHNGIIDSIDDTTSLIDELVKKGYHPEKDVYYLELKDGKHDVATWARAFPEFLKWAWGTGN